MVAKHSPPPKDARLHRHAAAPDAEHSSAAPARHALFAKVGCSPHSNVLLLLRAHCRPLRHAMSLWPGALQSLPMLPLNAGWQSPDTHTPPSAHSYVGSRAHVAPIAERGTHAPAVQKASTGHSRLVVHADPGL